MSGMSGRTPEGALSGPIEGPAGRGGKGRRKPGPPPPGQLAGVLWGLRQMETPQDLHAEMSTLGACMLGDTAALAKARELLDRDDFYRPAHGEIFDAMGSVAARPGPNGEAAGPVDIVTLRSELQARGTLDTVGGYQYLMALAEYVPTTASLEHYAQIVSEASALRRLFEGAETVARLAVAPKGDDADDAEGRLARAQRVIQDAAAPLLRRGAETWTRLSRALNEELEDIEERERQSRENPGGVTGIDTGLVAFNYLTSGLQAEDLVVIAGASSMGKTALLAIMARAAGGAALEKESGAVAFVSCEMGKHQVARRWLSAEARVCSSRIRSGLLERAEWDRLHVGTGALWDLPMYIDDRSFLSADQIEAACIRLRDQAGLSAVFVDYLQILSPGSRRPWDNRNVEVTEIARGLKRMAKNLKVPVVTACQISRSNARREDKRPILSDLRESGAIEQEADIVAAVHRPSYYEKKAELAPPGSYLEGEYPCEDAEVIILKQRNGAVGTCRAVYTPALTLFSDAPEDGGILGGEHEFGGF